MTISFSFIRAFLTSLFFILHLVGGYAQYRTDTTFVDWEEDSADIIIDSMISPPFVENEDYEVPDTLYFSGKDDPASFTDSSIIDLREVPDSLTAALKNDKAFWYLSDSSDKSNKPDNELTFMDKVWFFILTLLSSSSFQNIIWFLLVIIAPLTIIWYLFQKRIGLFTSRNPTAIKDLSGNGESEDIFSLDLDTLTKNAETAGDYRTAIRFSYLRLLKELAKNDEIQYMPSFSNTVYLEQLYERPYYGEFSRLTRIYEYTWYGELPVTSEQYNSIHQDFFSFYKKARIFI